MAAREGNNDNKGGGRGSSRENVDELEEVVNVEQQLLTRREEGW